MDKEGSVKIKALFIILSLIIAILPIYSLNDRPEEYIEEMNGECVGLESFTIDGSDVDYAILEVMGEGVQRYEESIIKQEDSEYYKNDISGTQTFVCKGEITRIDVCILPPYVPKPPESTIPGIPMPAPQRPPPVTVNLHIKDLQNDILFQSEFLVIPTSEQIPIWKSITISNLKLDGQYKLHLTGSTYFSWYYGSGYDGGSADFDANKDFCFRVHYKEEIIVYPELVQYKTDVMDSYKIVTANLQNETETITIPKEKIDGATELWLSSQNTSVNVLTKISWNLKVFHAVPETPAKLSLPFVNIEKSDRSPTSGMFILFDTTFQIRYIDINNDAPLSAKIYVNDTEYDLANEDDDPYQWNGSLYSITLPYEECNYYFVFDNGKETIRMPEEDSFYVGELEKKMSEWKINVEEESQLIDQELEMIDQYYIQENQSLGLLNDMIGTKVELVKTAAWNHRYMLDIHQLASEREEIQAFEDLNNTEILDAVNEIENNGFPEEVKEIFRNYGMTENDIESLRNDIIENKETIKTKRILSNFIDLKDVYMDLGLLHIESASFTFNIYTEEGRFTSITDNVVATAQSSVKTSWQSIDELSIDRMEIESILQNSKYLVEKGYPEYKDDFYAGLVYLYLSIAGDDEFFQELHNNSSYYIASVGCSECEEEETTWQEAFDFASTVKYQTINDIKPVIIIETENEDPIIGETSHLKSPLAGDFPCINSAPPKGVALAPNVETCYCGDGDCQGSIGENCSNCEDDCGPCSTLPPTTPPPGDPCERVTCPDDGYVGEKYCKNGDVYQKYRDYYCENGECKYTETEKRIKDCGEARCEKGGCIVNPLPDPCPCKDDHDVKELLRLKAIYEDNVQGVEDAIEEKREELANTLVEAAKALEQDNKAFDEFFGISDEEAVGGLVSILVALKEATLGGTTLLGLVIIKIYRLGKNMGGAPRELRKANIIINIIHKAEGDKSHWENKLQETIDELRNKCACALN